MRNEEGTDSEVVPIWHITPCRNVQRYTGQLDISARVRTRDEEAHQRNRRRYQQSDGEFDSDSVAARDFSQPFEEPFEVVAVEPHRHQRRLSQQDESLDDGDENQEVEVELPSRVPM